MFYCDIDFRRLRRSVILLEDIDGRRWCTLSQGPAMWVVRTYANDETTGRAYQPLFTDYNGDIHVLQQLSLPEVTRTLVRTVNHVSFMDFVEWQNIFSDLDERENQTVVEPADEDIDRPANIPTTSMRQVYDQFKLFSSLSCQLEMAKEIERVPQRLAECFLKSVAKFLTYKNEQDVFVPVLPTRKELPDPGSVTRIAGTEDLSSLVRESEVCVVENDPRLNFRFVDREIVTARTTGGVSYDTGAPARSGKRLDWLLVNDGNGRSNTPPILAEVKIGGDKNPFYALVQLLMYAAELVTPSQYRRLCRCYPKAYVEFQEGEDEQPEVPLFDLYIVLADYGYKSRVRCDLFETTENICSLLIERTEIGRYIRRIACLEADLPEDSPVTFRKAFCYSTLEEED